MELHLDCCSHLTFLTLQRGEEEEEEEMEEEEEEEEEDEDVRPCGCCPQGLLMSYLHFFPLCTPCRQPQLPLRPADSASLASFAVALKSGPPMRSRTPHKFARKLPRMPG